MAASDGFVAFVCDQLSDWGPVLAKRMFSSRGLFRAGTLFALVRDDTLYLRADELTEPDFRAAGMAPFQYRRAGRIAALGYWSVPAEVLDDRDDLAAWTEKAYAAALRRARSRAG